MSGIDTTNCGTVFVRDFDIGIYRSLDYFEVGEQTYVPLHRVPGVKPPLWDENHNVSSEIGTSMPGIPIIWKNPDDSTTRYNIPCFRISSEDPSPALERWRSDSLKFRAPSEDAQAVQVEYNGNTLSGYDSYDEQKAALPYDLPYTVSCEAGTRREAISMLKFMMFRFPAYSAILVEDSIGDMRKYTCFVEGPSDLSEMADLRDRTIIKALSIRVSGSLDTSEVKRMNPVRSKPVFNLRNKVV